MTCSAFLFLFGTGLLDDCKDSIHSLKNQGRSQPKATVNFMVVGKVVRKEKDLSHFLRASPFISPGKQSLKSPACAAAS